MDASRWINAWIAAHSFGSLHPSQFWALCLTPLALAALLIGLRPPAKLRGARAPLFLGLMFTTLLAARIPLLCRDYINVDEAFLTSLAMRISADPVPYRAADSTSSGPLNLYIIAIPAWFGASPSYVSARVTAILLMFGALAFLWLTLRRFLGESLAVLAVLPFFCFVTYASETDFTHASSEHLPVFLCALCCYLLTHFYQGGRGASIWVSAAVGVVASAMIFAKLQALPATGVLLTLAAVLAWGNVRRWRAITALCAGAASIPAAFLALFVHFGVLNEFWLSSFCRNLAYAAASGMSMVGKLSLARSMLLYFSNLEWYVLGLMPVWLAGALACAVAWRNGTICFRRDPGTRDALAVSIAAVLLALASFVAVATPGKPYTHYLLFLLAPFALMTGASVMWVRILCQVRPWGPSAVMAGSFFLAASSCLPTFLSVHADGARQSAWDIPKFNSSTLLADTIRRYVSPDETLVVWGWRSELHVASQRMPGTRYADSAPQLEPSPYLAHFRRVYLIDFLRSQPPVFVDAVGPGAFNYRNRATEGFETFEGLREAVARDYSQVGDLDGARVFVRKDRLNHVMTYGKLL